jgi:hypothetical protein
MDENKTPEAVVSRMRALRMLYEKGWVKTLEPETIWDLFEDTIALLEKQ